MDKNESSVKTNYSDQATTLPGSLQSTTIDPLTSIFTNNSNNKNDIASSLNADHFYTMTS